MKKFLWTMACIFGIATIILYFSSLNHWDEQTSRMLGTSTTINIQGTIFCAACAVITAINVVGAIVLSMLETMENNTAKSSFTPVTTSSYAVKGDVPLKADPKYTYLLSGANDVVVASQANNHALDYGEAGLNESIRNLKEAGIYVIGAGMNSAEASQPVVIESGDRKIIILNYMDADNFAEYRGVMDPATANSSGYSAYDSELAERQIQEARENGSSIIIAYLHYGNEYSRSPNDNQVKISHELINDGADIVIGSHAHVTQGVEMYNGKPIFYNLGNFIFDQSNPATHISYFLNLDLVEDNCTVTLYPTYISNYLPTFMDAESGKALINGLYPQCDEMNVTDEGTGVLTFKLGNVTNETS